jgi:hypothetical protein
MFELEQTIYYMRDSRVHSAPVLSRMSVENTHDEWAHTKEQKDLFTHFGPSGIFYYTCHGLVSSVEAYASKQELLETL